MSRQPGPYGRNPHLSSPRTPGSLGINDAANPDGPDWLVGDTPGSLGLNDWADPQCGFFLLMHKMHADPGTSPAAQPALGGQAASSFSLSADATTLLKGVETLHLKPYDDQTAKDITEWVEGATIGYGHLITKGEWDSYKNGITEIQAETLFDANRTTHVSMVGKVITVDITQNQFDALVILAYNIGPDFSSSSVVKLVNDPKAKTSYSSLESAWKAWNKSQGKVMKGLDNRRQCEWNIYSQAVYKRW
jgi:GH24 family phage-related lysozyme (muramidase)